MQAARDRLDGRRVLDAGRRRIVRNHNEAARANRFDLRERGLAQQELFLLLGRHRRIVDDHDRLRIARDDALQPTCVQPRGTSSITLRPPAAAINAVGIASAPAVIGLSVPLS
ncbi:Uncharacterised protein [Burkholderia mallei]|nr:periplasmic binding family domain protein [Burkholderia mallei]AJX64108.1 periplasmic binding family domain protein [Burkholderia mallei]AJY33272.1 periplasmic binding family domain protein [Burkholderia mallei]KIY07473.1 periplasmic binding family domain protein [Burkholderia mallei]SUW47073.1 Uncharacterised protein [Burkholderia mallei]